MYLTLKFDCSLTTKGYRKKTNPGNMMFRRTSLTASEMLQKMLEGYSSVGVFKTNKECFNKDVRTQENFESIQYIAFDIDDRTFSLEMMDFISLLTYKPTFAYTTFSDHITKYGYRLVYVFNKPIYGTYRYKGCYDAMKYIIELDTYKETCNHKTFTGEIDNAMRSSCQPIHGTKADAETYVSRIIYDYDEMFTDKLFNKAGVNTNLFDKPFISEMKLKGDCKLSDKFKSDFLDRETYIDKDGRERWHFKMSDREFFNEYEEESGFSDYEPSFRNRYNRQYLIIKTFKNMNKIYFDDEEPFRILDMLKSETTFFELEFKFHKEYYMTGESRITGKMAERITPVVYDGEGRRYKLYGYGCLLRLMDEEGMTLDRLVFYLFCLRMSIINNNDKLITREYLVQLAANIMSRDYRIMMEFYKAKQVKHYQSIIDKRAAEDERAKMNGSRKKKRCAANIKVKTNPEWCNIHHVRKMEVAAMAKSLHKYTDIYKKIDWNAKPFWKGNSDIAARNTLKDFISFVLRLDYVGWERPDHNREYGKHIGGVEIAPGVFFGIDQLGEIETWDTLEIKEMIMSSLHPEIIQFYKDHYNMVELTSPISKEQFLEICDKTKSREDNVRMFKDKTGGSEFTFHLYEILTNLKFMERKENVYDTKGEWKRILTKEDKNLKFKDLCKKVWGKYPNVPKGSINTWKYSK